MALRTVLLVEDSEMEALMLERGLREAIPRSNIVHCTTTTEAEDFLSRVAGDSSSKSKPDLVVLDVRVPPAGGVGLLEKLRSDSETKSIPVVMMSSHMADDDVQTLYQNGANSYLDKPVDFNEFISLVSAAAHYWLGLNLNVK